jgi:hypothetical protein
LGAALPTPLTFAGTGTICTAEAAGMAFGVARAAGSAATAPTPLCPKIIGQIWNSASITLTQIIALRIKTPAMPLHRPTKYSRNEGPARDQLSGRKSGTER